MKKAALLRGALVTPSSSTLGTDDGRGLGSVWSLVKKKNKGRSESLNVAVLGKKSRLNTYDTTVL